MFGAYSKFWSPDLKGNLIFFLFTRDRLSQPLSLELLRSNFQGKFSSFSYLQFNCLSPTHIQNKSPAVSTVPSLLSQIPQIMGIASSDLFKTLADTICIAPKKPAVKMSLGDFLQDTCPFPPLGGKLA